MMFNPIYKTAYYTMCSQYAYSLYKDRTIYDTTYQTTHHTMYNPIYKTGYNTMCSQYAGWTQVYYTGPGWPQVYNV